MNRGENPSPWLTTFHKLKHFLVLVLLAYYAFAYHYKILFYKINLNKSEAMNWLNQVHHILPPLKVAATTDFQADTT